MKEAKRLEQEIELKTELQRRKTRPPGSPPRASRLSFMIKVLSHHSHISRTVKITNGALIGHPETRPYIYGISRIGKKKTGYRRTENSFS